MKNFRNEIERRKGAKEILENRLSSLKKEIISLKVERKVIEKARLIIQKAAKETQDNLKYQLTELAKLGLSTVFDEPYDFEISFENKGSKTEADFWLIKNNERINPRTNCGIGTIDIAGVSLRLSLWSLSGRRPVIFLDEPFKHLKGSEPNKRALDFLKCLCVPQPEKNWPGIQIIMVADERATREEILAVSDKVYEFKMKNNKTFVRSIK